MKIVFWSCVPGQSGTTASMVALASMMAVGQNISCSLLQTRYKGNGLQNAFIPARDTASIQKLDDFGVDALIRDVKSGSADSTSLADCGFTFFSSKLNLYTESCATSEGVYRKDVEANLSAILAHLEEAFDVTLLDVEAGNDPLSLRALEGADLVVVCLPQSYRVIDFFFEKYLIDSVNVFYLFGDYDDKQTCSLKTLRSRYRKQGLTVNNSGAILHSAEYADALNTSTVCKYFLRNVNCKKNDTNYDFMVGVYETMCKMLKTLGVKIAEQKIAEQGGSRWR